MQRVLIVDDEENTRIGLGKLLTGHGYHVAVACNGHAALECLEQEPIDLVITDINMPGMNGLIFLRALNSAYPQVKVIMITAYGGVESYLEAMNLGAFEYLNKPVKLEELKAVITKIFSDCNRPTSTLKGPAAAP